MPELIEMSGQPHRTSPTLATLGFFTGVSGRASKTLLTSEVFHPWRLLSYTMSQTGRNPPPPKSQVFWSMVIILALRWLRQEAQD